MKMKHMKTEVLVSERGILNPVKLSMDFKVMVSPLNAGHNFQEAQRVDGRRSRTENMPV